MYRVTRSFAVGVFEFPEGLILTDEDILTKYSHLALGRFAGWLQPVELYFKG